MFFFVVCIVSPVQQQPYRQLPFLKEINWRRKGSQSNRKQDSTRSAGERGARKRSNAESPCSRNSAEFQSPMVSMSIDDTLEGSNNLKPLPEDEIKRGNLTKSTQHRRNDARPGPKQKRKFKLTSEALEYYHISQVKYLFYKIDFWAYLLLFMTVSEKGGVCSIEVVCFLIIY